MGFGLRQSVRFGPGRPTASTRGVSAQVAAVGCGCPLARASWHWAGQQIASGRDLSGHPDLRLLLVGGLPAAVTVEELLELKAIAEPTNACVVAIVGEGTGTSPAELEHSASWPPTSRGSCGPGPRHHPPDPTAPGRRRLTCWSCGTDETGSARSRRPSRGTTPASTTARCHHVVVGRGCSDPDRLLLMELSSVQVCRCPHRLAVRASTAPAASRRWSAHSTVPPVQRPHHRW